VARLKRPDGTVEICKAHYIAGCDGARSAGARSPGDRIWRRHL
jgi:2-polyprenyl-6-methoxyphenol hydroxylase-like FAD-dependent oxidoreductase